MAEGRLITAKYLLDHLNENELDLSVTNLSEVPVKELVRELKICSHIDPCPPLVSCPRPYFSGIGSGNISHIELFHGIQ